MRALAFWLGLAVLSLQGAVDGPEGAPWVNRLEPFGAARGETVEVALVGETLDSPLEVIFDNPSITWIETVSAGTETIRGRVRVAPDAPLGPHIVTLRTANGRANSRLFYVDAFPSINEAEPNDVPEKAQGLELRPQVVHGMLPESPDRDFYRFRAKSGERWVFDVRSIEYGGFLECDLALLDDGGGQIAFNDDRDEYLETPTLEHVFQADGEYLLRVDQYRGPQGVNCNKNCGYMLRISQTPRLTSAFPLGAKSGSSVTVSLRGSALEGLRGVRLLPVRSGEYYRLTFPYTMPLRPEGLPPVAAIEGKILEASREEARVRFDIPPDAPAGLWRIWLETAAGPADELSFEIQGAPELAEAGASIDLSNGPLVINGSLSRDEEEDFFTVRAQAGRPLHFSVLAVQLGLPAIDPVLELFDAQGKLLAEHDDLMTGQGTVIGNPDPSLYYMPAADGELRLVLRDRIGRGGPDFVYRLKADAQTPGFRLLTDPENPSVKRGADGAIGVLLIRDPGFDGQVEVWAEAPQGLTIGRDAFRDDQFFGPSADGDNVIIPEVFLSVEADASMKPGDYAIRIFGRDHSGRQLEAYSTLWIGPPRKRNDVRRPLPQILVTVQ
jgi:hypothetical protein